MVQIKVCRFRPYLTLTLESGKKAFQNCIVIKIDFTRSHVQVNNETTCKGTLHERYRCNMSLYSYKLKAVFRVYGIDLQLAMNTFT